MNQYRVLIVGCGAQGVGVGQEKNPSKIINFAHAITEHEGFNLLGFHDIDKEKAANAAIAWKTDYWSGYPINVDVIIIATPDDDHYESLKKALGRKPKLVIVEKPICNNLQQAREIVQLYKVKEIPLCVNYTRNFLPYYEDLKQRYKSGEFGRIVFANVVFNRGWLHSATHAISFLEWFFGGQYNGKIMECETDYRIWQMDLFFEKYHWREERIGDQPVWEYYDKSHWYVVDNVYQFLEGKEELKCTGEDGLRALEICYKLMEGK